jgi:hypothetical protein
MVNSDFVNPIEKLFEFQWCIPAQERIYNFDMEANLSPRKLLKSAKMLLHYRALS